MLKGYHSRIDEEGVAVDAPAAKKRRGRRASQPQGQKPDAKSQMPDNQTPEIKIGTAKQQAIKNILMSATPSSFRSMTTHLSFTGGERRSALSPEVLAWKHLWTGSQAPEGQTPTEPEEIARRASAATARKSLPSRIMPFDCTDLLHMFALLCWVWSAGV